MTGPEFLQRLEEDFFALALGFAVAYAVDFIWKRSKKNIERKLSDLKK